MAQTFERLRASDTVHDVIQLPYTKQLVEAAPEIDADDDLGGVALAQVRRHFAAVREPPLVGEESGGHTPPRTVTHTVSPDGDDGLPPAPGISDDGEVIEIPIIAEEVVKRPVVKEVIRVRKDTVTHQQPVETTLRREELVVDEQGEVAVTTDDATTVQR